uniref:Uncharacterized protein n=1 Tax=Sphaerodactylus townsendi TaxID=933632 RepID=A0ACB8FV21_9SAUR
MSGEEEKEYTSGEEEEEQNSNLISEEQKEISQKISENHGVGSNANNVMRDISEVPKMDTETDILQMDSSSGMAQSSTAGVQQDQTSDEFLKNFTEPLESAPEVSQQDSRKDSQHSSQKIPVILMPDTKDTDLMAYIELCALDQLKSLDLSENKIESIPSELHQLSEKISELSSLKELDVSHNELQELPEALGEIKTLTTLIANDNCLRKLPKNFSSLRNLQRLDLSNNKLIALPSDLHFLQSLKDINFDGNALVRPPLEVCKAKQMLPITRILESADERDEKILQSVLKTIASNVPFENFEFFCQKLQLKNDVYKSIENNRALTIEEKVTQALDRWKTENETLSPDAMTDQLIRVLTMTGMYYLTNKIKALKLCSRIVKF